MPEEKPDLNALRDKAVEFAKDLLMVDFQPLLDEIDADRKKGVVSPSQFHNPEKTACFEGLLASLKAARFPSEGSRIAHIAEQKRDLKAEMESQFKDRLREIEAMNHSEEPKAVS